MKSTGSYGALLSRLVMVEVVVDTKLETSFVTLIWLVALAGTPVSMSESVEVICTE